jgi:hypothetical protein
MPSGGARKNAGRKPKPLSEKLSAPSRGHRPLKKVEWEGGNHRPEPPKYLDIMISRADSAIPRPSDIFTEIVDYLEPSDCLNLIPVHLIVDYSLAKHLLLAAHWELAQTAIVIENGDNEIVVSSFTEAVLKLQKNMMLTWEPIWDIVSRNSEKILKPMENDPILITMVNRTRKPRPQGEDSDG